MATNAPYNSRQHAEATQCGEELAARPTALVSAKLDEQAKALRLRFRTGIELRIPIKVITELAKVPITRLRDVKASPFGDGLIFSDLGEAFYVPGLLRDLFSDAFAGALGKIGGRATSPAKRAAARKNGRKGGRPRMAA